MTNRKSSEINALHDRLKELNERCKGLERVNQDLEKELQGFSRQQATVESSPSAGTDLLTMGSRLRELTSELHRSFHYISVIRGHLDLLFASRRWRIGSLIGDAHLKIRGLSRPPTAEDHLQEIFQEIDSWEARRRAHPIEGTFGVGVPSSTEFRRSTAVPARTARIDRGKSLFYNYVDEILKTCGDCAFERSFENSESIVAISDATTSRSMEPLVSVVMPTYNRCHVVAEAVRSVLEQNYSKWELIVSDDGSTDGTRELVEGFGDPRIRYRWQENAGAAVARNRALTEAQGELVAYLDSDNLWHPSYLAMMVDQLESHAGQYCAYCRHIDVVMEGEAYRVRGFRSRVFDYESLTKKNFVDLNAFVHRRELSDVLGGFDDRLRRQQDWDLVLKYAFLRDPLYVDALLVLYRRNPDWHQITTVQHDNLATVEIICENQHRRYQDGLTIAVKTPRPSVSVLSWDICRNHFSKAYNLAEAWSHDRDVELVGFRFFEDAVFPPYANETPSFETKYFSGEDFPTFRREFTRALASLRGDIIYAVKPRLPSLGLALLANYHFGKPVVLEINDLESVVADPTTGTVEPPLDFGEIRPNDQRLLNPFDQVWSRLFESLAVDLPFLVTHNRNLDRHFGNTSHQIRNLKDESIFDPNLYTREEIRRRLGFDSQDVVLLFGGMVRRHKGIFALMDFVENLGDERYKLLVVSSRSSPDERELKRRGGTQVRIIPPQGRNAMVEFNIAADAAILWLDPAVPASHYQMPFKLTDAIATGLPVLANPVSDLTDLGQLGYIRLVEYGDFPGLSRALEQILADPTETQLSVDRARLLYLRQFSYRAARANIELILRRAARDSRCLPEAMRFVEFFSRFYEESSG